MSDRTKAVIVFIVTAVVTLTASLTQGYLWDSSLADKSLALVLNFVCALALGSIGYVVGKSWYHTWTGR